MTNVWLLVQLHGGICKDLTGVYAKVLGIFPELEAARPRSTTGIQALCALHIALEKIKTILQHCAECSKLYLVSVPLCIASVILQWLLIWDWASLSVINYDYHSFKSRHLVSLALPRKLIWACLWPYNNFTWSWGPTNYSLNANSRFAAMEIFFPSLLLIGIFIWSGNNWRLGCP